MANIVITGCTRGLGLALLEEFQRRGHRVSGCGRNADTIRELASRFPDGVFRALDVTDMDAVQAWADDVTEVVGAPDILINNAAIINRRASLWEITPEEFGRVLDINLKGVHVIIRAFMPALLERGSGMIFNLSSGWGRSTSPEVAPYCCSKWGIEGMSKAMAQECPPGIGVIPFNPGIIDTDMLRSCFEDQARSYPGPAEWAPQAVDTLLSLGPEKSGVSCTAGD